MKPYPMTPAGKTKLEQELTDLKEIRQAELNEQIKKARSFCDFGEDVVFREMIDTQAGVEAEIKRIEHILANATIIETVSTETVAIGSTVTFIELPDGEAETYTIVGDVEANPAVQKISEHSPIGKSLLGHRVDDEIRILTPYGEMHVKINKIH